MAATAHSGKLDGQAASAAMLADQHQRAKTKKQSILDEDGRLSSASAATSLKYAKAQDLPSFPSAGLKMSSAGAAASLAESNKKQFEHWKPGNIPAANRAALLAKDYEMDPLWQPELSTAGSKAALLAHKDPPTVELPHIPNSPQGQSAAGQALRTKHTVNAPERDVPADARRKALMAATGAMSNRRPRADSMPITQPSDSRSWALKAATKSHRESPASQPFASGDPGFEAARIQNMSKNNVNKEMFGSAPPVSIEVEEKNRQDALRAPAIAMAQKMYAIQQSHIDEASGISQSGSHAAATTSHRRNLSDQSIKGTESSSAPRYENLEEAARKLAQERLAKLHDEHAEYRSYYGAKSPPPKSRLSMRIRNRRASTGDESDSDTEQSRRIRHQMSLFTSKLAEVDKNKRQADRDKLLEAAHRNVEARMNKLDEKVFQDTGKASPAQRELWERQARERAQKQVDLALQNVGKVHIGGGQYLDQAEVDAIAKARLQPTLDEITDNAERMRARDAEIRADQERIASENAARKARDAEIKAELKAGQQREKEEAKAKRDEEKRAQREQTNAEKEARKAEVSAEKEKARLEKDEKRKSKDNKAGRFSSILRGKPAAATDDTVDTGSPQVAQASEAATITTTTAEPVHATVHDQVTQPRSASHNSASTDSARGNEAVAATNAQRDTAVSPTKSDSRVKSWFKTHLRGPSKANKEDTTSLGKANSGGKDDSLRDVAMAGRSDNATVTAPVAEPASPSEKSSSVSSLSSSDPGALTTQGAGEGSEEAESSKGLKQKLLSKVRKDKGTNSVDGDREEARDTVEDKLTAPVVHGSERPRSSHEGSKFKEEL